MKVRQDVGYSKGGGSARSGGKPVGNDLNWKYIGYSGTVGGTAADITVLCKRDRL